MRHQFGGTMDAWVVHDVDGGSVAEAGTRLVSLPPTDLELAVYDAYDGERVTDLRDADDEPIDALVIPAGNPYIPRFYGPEDITELWIQSGAGNWLPIPKHPTAEPDEPDEPVYADTTGIDVREFGAVGDGTTDDQAAIQAALDEASASSLPRTIRLPAGAYKLSGSVSMSGSSAISGEGPERSVLNLASNAQLVAGSTTVSAPHGFALSDFTLRSTGGTLGPNPMVDVIQHGRKWMVERVNFDANFGDRVGLRLYSAWVGTVRDCNFWKFGTEGTASNRAALQIKPQHLSATANGPINNVIVEGCAFERVQTAIDLHDPGESGTTTTIYSVEIRNARFKNSATSGTMANSVGIRSNNNNTFNIHVTTPFFEDFAVGMIVRGWGWVIDSPFAQSADVVIDITAGGAHSIRSLILQGSQNNAIGTGVRAYSGLSTSELRFWKSVTGMTYLTAPVDDKSNGKLVVTPS